MEERLETLEKACRELLEFIEAFGGGGCQDNYLAFKAARAALAANSPVEVLAKQYLRIATLRSVLQFYADVSGYDVPERHSAREYLGAKYGHIVQSDRGRRARAVLKADDAD